MKKRTRRFDEGGGIREGRNANIDDDTRKRAMAMIARLNESSSEDQDMADEARMAESKPLAVRRARPAQSAPVAPKPVSRPAPAAPVASKPVAPPERRVSPGGPEGGLDYAVSPGGPEGGLDYADAPRRSTATRASVDQIPGYTGKNAGTLGKGPARNPSEAERFAYNAMNALGPKGVAGRAGRAIESGIGQLISAGNAGRKAGIAEKAAERTAQEVARGSRRRVPSSFERMADEAPQMIMPKRPPAPKKDTLRQARTKKQTARKNEEMQDELTRFADEGNPNFKRGGKVSSASRRADGIAMRGKTRGRVL